MVQSLKKSGLLLLFICLFAPAVHGQGAKKADPNTTNLVAYQAKKGHYLGGEIGYGGGSSSWFHIGFRYATSFRIGRAGKALFDIQPTAGISTGWAQYLRFEGGANLGVGANINQVNFSFVMLGLHLNLHASAWAYPFGIGLMFTLPLSINVYWNRLLFALHWGVELNWGLGGPVGGYSTPLYFRLVAAYRYN